MRTRSGLLMALAAIGMELAVASATAGDKETGILTDRLSTKQLRTWRLIEDVVSAKGQDGQPLHPRLHDLWQRIEGGRHVVHIEFPKTTNIDSNSAGSFRLEQCDPDNRRCEGVIRLSLSTIENSLLSKENRPTEGFIPFKGLGKIERYAEVLGHEMEHAVRVFENPHYAGMAAELEKQAREFGDFLRQNAKGKLHERESEERIARLTSLSDELERPAVLTEAEIWYELREGQSVRFGAMR